MSKRRNTLWTVVVCLFFGLIFFAALFDPAVRFQSRNDIPQPDFLFENVVISNLENGSPTWKLKAKSATIDKGSGETVLHFLSGEFFQREKPVVSLDAPKASIRLDNSDMSLFQAKAKYSVGTQWVELRAENLIWYSGVQEFLATGNVWVKSGLLELQGQQFQVRFPVRTMRMADHARAIYSSPSS